MRYARTLTALLALLAVDAWNRLVSRGEPVADTDADDDAPLTEHERSWYDYLRGFHAHHGTGERAVDGDHPEHGSFWTGLRLWHGTRCLRGYTVGDDIYLCPNAPRVVRVHQAGHAPSFAAGFEPLRTERRDDGGLEDEPLPTLDVMLPGRFPHTFLRLCDPRGLGRTYAEWLRDGRIRRL